MNDYFQIQEKMKNSAIWYQKHGFSILPLMWKRKNSIFRGWSNDKEINPEEALSYFKSPCNIGLVTGSRSSKMIGNIKYKLVAIDIDNKGGHDGTKAIEEWQEEHGYFPRTWRESTPNKGEHYYFWIEADVKAKTMAGVLDGVDLRGDGGYMVVSPSFLDYKEKDTESYGYYEWLVSPEETEIAIANESVINLLKVANTKEKKPSNLAESDGKEQPQKPSEQMKIKQGERVQFLVKIVAQQDFKSNLLGLEDIKNLLRLINKSRLEPPLSETELEKEVFPSIERFKLYTQNKVIFDQSMLVSMDEVEEQTVEWLIPGWIPKGTITIMGGDGGVGKTTLWCSLVADLTNGKSTILENPFEVGEREPINVLFFSSEDDTSRVIKPRLRKNDADMHRVKTIPLSSDAFSQLTFDSDLLEQMIQIEKPGLCIFDPIQSFVGDIDMNKRSQMRIQMDYLMKLGERYGTAFLVAMHTNKRTSVNGRSRFAESSDIYDISRSAILVGNTKNKETKYIDHAKSNYSKLQKTVLFTIEDGKPFFGGTTDKKDYDFMNEKTIQGKGSQLGEAKEYIVYFLRTNGRSEWKNLISEAKDIEGISERTMYRAKKELINEKEILETKTSLGKAQGTKLTVEINYSK